MWSQSHLILLSQADRNNRERRMSGMLFASGQQKFSALVVIAAYHRAGSQTVMC